MNKQSDVFLSSLDFSDMALDDLLNQLSPMLRSHSRRVAICTAIMAECADKLLPPYTAPSETSMATIAYLGGTCHDLGKLLIPNPCKDKHEYMLHPIIGKQLLEANIHSLFNNQVQANIVLDIIQYHHERPDGRGFPMGSYGKDIPLTAGLCAIANWLDHRIYPEKWNPSDINVILNDAKALEGSYFFESVVACFEYAWPQLITRYAEWDQSEQ